MTKRSRRMSMYSGIMALAFLVSACTGGAESGEHHPHHDVPTETTHAAHDHAPGAHAEETLYGCPMHKEMVGSHGDRCPKCNYMEMIPVTWSLEGVETVRVTSLPDYNPPKN